MSRNPLLAAFASQPALVAPEMQDSFESCLDYAAACPRFAELSAEAATTASNDDNFWPAADDWRAAYRPYVVVDGILQIPVKGVLLHEFPWALGGWATGYDYIWRAFERGMCDGSVRGIALIINSPGGTVAGCFEATDKMVALKAEAGKPVQSFAHESAYSAAYAIASVGDKLTVSRTGGVGSIGVVTTHVDFSKRLEADGIKVTFIHAGKHKVDGNPYEALSPEVKARIQERIDELYSIFVSTVAVNRNLDEQAVRDTEALTFSASQSLSNGLADAIGTLDDALAAFVADLSEPQGEESMSDQDTSAAISAAVDKAVAEANATAATALTSAVAEARTTERTRIAAILGSDEAQGRGDLASHLALETDTGADAAVAILGKSNKESATDAGTGFNAAMNNGNPEVGANADENTGNADDSDPVALARSVGLAGLRPAK